MAGGFSGVLGLTLGVGDAYIPHPVVDSLIGVQRDTGATFLVDVTAVVHEASESDLDAVLEYSTDPAGPWTACTIQPYDRRHTAGDPLLLTPVPSTNPGDPFVFVWDAFFDLPEFNGEVYVRLTVVNVATLDDVEVSAAFEIDTREQKTQPTPLEKQIAKRGAAARAPQDYLGFGLLAPFERGANDFKSGGREELVMGCARRVLGIEAAVGPFPGEIPWRPDFGSKLWYLRHRNQDGALEEVAIAYAREALLWEPRLIAGDVKIQGGPDETPGELHVVVPVSLIESDVAGNRVILPQGEVTLDVGG